MSKELLQKALDALVNTVPRTAEQANKQIDAIVALRTELAAIAQPAQQTLDAARYRKLRDNKQDDCVVNGELLRGELLDHAVDNLPNTEANKC